MADDLKRRQTIDPATADILGAMEQKQAEARQTRSVRTKKKKERDKAKARLPRRVNWDLPTDIKEQVVAIAEHHRIPTSQVAALLLANGLERLELGELDLEAHKVPSASPRYDWNLILGDEE